MEDLVKLGRSRPDGINVGSGGVGGAGHLVILALGKLNDFAVTHVAYKGTAPALNDVLGGSIDAASMAIGGVKAQVAAGIVRPVLVAASERSPLLPEVPVMKEFGLKGVNGGVGFVLAAPAGTPPEIAQKLHKSMAGARQEVEEQTATWAPIIRELGLKLE